LPFFLFLVIAGGVWRVTQFVQGILRGVAEGRAGRKLEQRGFELKLTGDDPVSSEKERENDHG